MNGALRVLCLALIGLNSCALLIRARVDAVATSVQKPSNVALYVAVQDSRRPVTGLTPSNFKVFENGQPVAPEESRLTLLDRNLAAAHHVLVLVDMSGARDEALRHRIARAVAGFVDRARTDQPVSLFAFDGSRDIQLAGEFPKLLGGAPPLDEVPGLLSYSVRDPSRNLYGAVAQSIEELDRRLAAAQKPVRIGTLVVFSRGPDAAGRLTDQQLRKLLEQTRHHLLAIGLQNTPRDYYLTELGRTETLRAQDEQKLGPTFESAASRVNALYDMYYLVSYCSPARAGVRRLRLQVDFKTPQGDEKRGRVEREFDATGFGPGCDPETPPRFALSAEGQAQATDPRETSPDSKPNSSKAPRPRAPQPADDAADSASDSDTDSIVPPPQKPGYAPRVR